MEVFTTISPKRLDRVKENYHVFFSLSDEKIDAVLKFLEYGRIIPSLYLEHREEEVSRKISEICDIDERASDQIINVIVNILRRVARRGFIPNRASDLKKMGFKESDVKRFRKIARLLKQKKADKDIKRVDKWREMFSEILPQLISIEYSFDIRCSVKGRKIEESLPIVLIKLETEGGEDETHDELVFQLDVGMAKHFARIFTKMYKEAQVLRNYQVQLKRRKK